MLPERQYSKWILEGSLVIVVSEFLTLRWMNHLRWEEVLNVRYLPTMTTMRPTLQGHRSPQSMKTLRTTQIGKGSSPISKHVKTSVRLPLILMLHRILKIRCRNWACTTATKMCRRGHLNAFLLTTSGKRSLRRWYRTQLISGVLSPALLQLWGATL